MAEREGMEKRTHRKKNRTPTPPSVEHRAITGTPFREPKKNRPPLNRPFPEISKDQSECNARARAFRLYELPFSDYPNTSIFTHISFSKKGGGQISLPAVSVFHVCFSAVDPRFTEVISGGEVGAGRSVHLG